MSANDATGGKDLDGEAFVAAANELPAVRRAVFTKAVWGGLDPDEVVDWLAVRGVQLTIDRVKQHFWAAVKYCLERSRQQASPHSISIGKHSVVAAVKLNVAATEATASQKTGALLPSEKQIRVSAWSVRDSSLLRSTRIRYV